MAPAPVNASSTLRPTRAAHRYRKGQAPAGYGEDDEDEDSDEQDEQEQQAQNEEDEQAAIVRKRKAAAALKAKELAAAQRRDGLQVINQGQQPRSAAATNQMQVKVKTDPDSLLAAAKVKKGDSRLHKLYTYVYID